MTPDNQALWKAYRNTSSHLLLRAPALLELARRGCEGVYDECLQLLDTDEKEEWIVAVDALGELSSNQALRKLTDMLEVSDPNVRKRVMRMIVFSLKKRALAKAVEKAERDREYASKVEAMRAPR